MASAPVRIALVCKKNAVKKGAKLLDEPIWRTYGNGKKWGAEEWKVLIESSRANFNGCWVLPGRGNGAGSESELMYMRAKDSEAFYRMNPDGTGGPELSIYLHRA